MSAGIQVKILENSYLRSVTIFQSDEATSPFDDLLIMVKIKEALKYFYSVLYPIYAQTLTRYLSKLDWFRY